MCKNDQIGDIELNAAVGGRTEVTREQYEKILAQKFADQRNAQKP